MQYPPSGLGKSRLGYLVVALIYGWFFFIVGMLFVLSILLLDHGSQNSFCSEFSGRGHKKELFTLLCQGGRPWPSLGVAGFATVLIWYSWKLFEIEFFHRHKGKICCTNKGIRAFVFIPNIFSAYDWVFVPWSDLVAVEHISKRWGLYTLPAVVVSIRVLDRESDAGRKERNIKLVFGQQFMDSVQQTLISIAENRPDLGQQIVSAYEGMISERNSKFSA